MLRAHDRDDRKRSQSPPDQASSTSSTDVHVVTRDNGSQVADSHPSSRGGTGNRMFAVDYQMSTAAAVIYCVQPQCNVLSIPSYLVAPAWSAGR